MQQLHYSRFSIHSMVPPSTDAPSVLQRADEVNTVLRMLSDPQTGTVVLTGDAGAGKSTLAALVYRHLQLATQAGLLSPAIQHFGWLSLGPYATLSDVMTAIAGSFGLDIQGEAGASAAHTLEALRCLGESVFIVLDQFEELLDPGSYENLGGHGTIPQLLEMLRQDLGGNRLLLTCHRSPYGAGNGYNSHVRSYLVSRVSIPEGIALLQQRGVQGSHEELSLVWQRCAGHVYALILFSTLFTLSGFALSYLLNSPDYAQLWSGEVTLNLVRAVYHLLNPMHRTLMRSLCLFNEPVPVQGIMKAIMGENAVPGDYANNIGAFQRALDVLAKLSLVQPVDERGAFERVTPGAYPDGYMLHPLLRQYIREHYLDGSGRRPSEDYATALGVTAWSTASMNNPEAQQIALAAGHMRVAAYYAELAHNRCVPREMRSDLQDVEPLLAAIYHLCLGWHWQQAYDLLLTEGLHEDLIQWGAWHTLTRLYATMVPPHGVLTRRDEGQVFSDLGLLYGRLADHAQSRSCYEQALAIQREIGDRHGEAVTLANQGEILRSLGETQQARANFEQALLLNGQQGDPHVESVLLHNLGLLTQNEKDYQQAFAYYVEALKLAKSEQEQYHEGLILTNMGMLLYEQGRLAEALELLFYALRLRQSMGDPTANAIELFLDALERKMGTEAFARLRQEANRMNHIL